MNKGVLAITMVIATSLTTGSVALADRQADKQAITEAYKAQTDAMERQDVDEMFDIFAPNATITAPDGKVMPLNTEQQRQIWRNTFQGMNQVKVHTTIKQLEINGTSATVLYRTQFRANVFNPKYGPQIYETITHTGLYEDKWRYTHNGWKVVNGRVLEQNSIKGPIQGLNGLQQQQQYNEDMQHALNCINGIGYGCGSSPR